MSIDGTPGNAQWNVYNLGGGNSNLESENAKTYSFGVDWKPEGVLNGLSAGVSYYDVVYNNIIYKPGFPDLVFNPAFYSQRIVGNEATPTVPTPINPAIMTGIYAQYPPDRYVAPGQTFDLVAGTYAINMFKRTFGGIDFNLRYDWDTSLGKWGVGINGNKQTKRQTQPVRGGPVSDDIGTYVAPVWQGAFRAQWAASAIPLRLTWVANYRGSYNLVNTNWGYGGDSQILHNLTVAYDLENLFKGVTLQARVLNVTDSDPPFNDSTLGYDDDNHNPYGRQFNVSVRARF
jgi:iron complex outermembrane recepter protein